MLRGRSIIQDAFLEDFERLYPEQANLFAVRRLLWAEQGNTYSRGETGEWLQDAGFVKGLAT